MPFEKTEEKKSNEPDMNLCLYQKLDINGHTIFFSSKKYKSVFFKSQFFSLLDQALLKLVFTKCESFQGAENPIP